MTPLTSAFVNEVFIAARAVARTQPGERLDPTLRFVLDEIPNLCPLRHLDEYISDGRGRGLPVIWFAQTPSQLNDVFGTHKAQTIISASEVMIYGGGVRDPDDFYRGLSALIGNIDMPRTSQGTDAYGNVTTQTHHQSQAIIEPSELFKLDKVFNRHRELQHCEALLLARGVGGALVRVVPWWQRKDAEVIRAGIDQARAQQTALVAA